MRRVGMLLAGLALYLQLALASSGILASATPASPADAFGGHALCLAGGNNIAPPAPDVPVPTPPHDHGALCCLWHALLGVAPHAVPAPVPVAYSAIAHSDGRPTVLQTRPSRTPVEPRAPPIA